MRTMRKVLALSVMVVMSLLVALPVVMHAQTQMNKVKHVFIIRMENHNWTASLTKLGGS